MMLAILAARIMQIELLSPGIQHDSDMINAELYVLIADLEQYIRQESEKSGLIVLYSMRCMPHGPELKVC